MHASFRAVPLMILSAAIVAAQPQPPRSRSVPSGVPILDIDRLPRLEAPRIDAPTLRHRYHQTDRDRISEPTDVHVTPENSGVWETLEDGSRMWRLRVSAPGSLTIAMIFENFHLPPDAQMYVSAVTGELVRKLPYTAASNPANGLFATGPLPSDEAIIEVDVPAAEAADVRLTMTQVNRGFVKLAPLLGKAAQFTAKYTEPDTSGECEVNVACSQGQGKFKNPSQGVGMIITAEGRLCSGTLITNTSKDFHQYFLTASHCGAVNGWSIVFNFESATCTRGGSSSLADQVTNIVEVARSNFSDFLLVEIRETIPPQFDVFFNGFFTPNLVPLSGAAVIHHPGGNVKKISATFEPLVDSAFVAGLVFTDWRIEQYNVGITEPGSSGAPLFNTNLGVIGQIHGGFSACDPYPGGPDYAGKFSLSFASGEATRTQVLSTFLDPNSLISDPNDQVQGNIPGSFPPGSLISQVWTALTALIKTTNLPVPASATLHDAVDHLNNALAAASWSQGPAFLDGIRGPLVFVEAGLAAASLKTLLAHYSSSFPAGSIQPQIDQLIVGVRLIVQVGLEQSGPVVAVPINGLLASGDVAAAGGNPVTAIAEYGLAWLLEQPHYASSIAITKGNNQSAAVGTAFSPLQILVRDAFGKPMPAGVPVRFAIPNYGTSHQPSGNFSNGDQVITLTTAANGTIVVPITANSVPGSFTVNLFAIGVKSPPSFSLTNK